MDELHQLEGVAARALQFTVLAVARTGETLGAKWSEIDWDRQLWVVPPQRMKSGREHSQPLSSAALDLLRQLPRDGDYIFPGRRGRPLPPKALLIQGSRSPTYRRALRRRRA
jgi:integrase